MDGSVRPGCCDLEAQTVESSRNQEPEVEVLMDGLGSMGH